MTDREMRTRSDNRIIVYRWFYYLTLLLLTAYFVIPALVFPSEYVFHIEVISALTLGPLVAVYLLLVNIVGWFLDRRRRGLYLAMLGLALIWLVWAVYSWTYIDRMDYILR